MDKKRTTKRGGSAASDAVSSLVNDNSFYRIASVSAPFGKEATGGRRTVKGGTSVPLPVIDQMYLFQDHSFPAYAKEPPTLGAYGGKKKVAPKKKATPKKKVSPKKK